MSRMSKNLYLNNMGSHLALTLKTPHKFHIFQILEQVMT